MKKFLIILLSLALFVFCVGCGTYTPPKDPGEDISGKPGTTPGKPGNQDGPDVDGPGFEDGDNELVFTVTLTIKNSFGELVRYSPRPTDDISAQWSSDGGNDNHVAKFDSMGVATCKGLDGEYRVTLSNLPSDRIYDPNGNYVDNDFRDLTIELLDVKSTGKNTGKGLYVQQGTCIPLNSVGTYKARVEKKYVKGKTDEVRDGSIIYFEYTPTEPGYYSLESIVDIVDAKVNPMVDVFTGSSQFKRYDSTIDDGGKSGNFTKNFKWEMVIAQGYTGNCFTFAIKADVANGVKWPVDIYFTLTYIGATIPTEIVQAKGPFYNGPAMTGTYNWSFKDNYNSATSRYSTSGDIQYELYWSDLNGNGIWDEGDLGDGFYHEFSLEKYPDGYSDATGTYPAGWGPILWTIIAGWDEINHSYIGSPGDPPPPPIPVDNLLGKADNINGKNYNFFLKEYNKYSIDLKTYKEQGGSITTTIHPVTKELMEALQEIAPYLGYFQDGDGFAEKYDRNAIYHSPYLVDSDEDHMWLIFCGYFK